MFTFFHRKKKIVVDCLTCLPAAYEYTPIVRASKTIPDWWKKLEHVGPLKKENGVYDIENNMKNCYGFVELYKRGAVIENWCDIYLNVSQEGYEYYKSYGIAPQQHRREEYKGGFENYHHIKLISPWHFREKTGMHFLFMGAEWAIEYPVKVLPGVVQYRDNCGTHINMMLPKYHESYDFTLKLGQPLAHIIPLNDDVKVEFKNHLLTEEELKKEMRFGGLSLDGMRGVTDIVKRNNARKCPFGFG
jgi:hypothetical protein